MNTSSDWQTWAALAIVIATAAIFASRALRKKKSGCAGGCSCEAAAKPKFPAVRH